MSLCDCLDCAVCSSNHEDPSNEREHEHEHEHRDLFGREQEVQIHAYAVPASKQGKPVSWCFRRLEDIAEPFHSLEKKDVQV